MIPTILFGINLLLASWRIQYKRTQTLFVFNPYPVQREMQCFSRINLIRREKWQIVTSNSTGAAWWLGGLTESHICQPYKMWWRPDLEKSFEDQH